MQNLFEFFFCPQHGIFAPVNWAWMAPALSSGIITGKAAWSRIVLSIKAGLSWRP